MSRPVSSQRVMLISDHIQEYLRTNKINGAKPKDVMEYLIEKGDFTKDHRKGLPLRNILRELDDTGRLHLIKGVRVERKTKNRYWYFDIA